MLFLILLLFLLVCGGLAAMTVLNLSTQVHLSFYFWQSPDLPVGFWLMAAFFLGALLLYLVSVNSAFSERREMKRLRQRVSALEQEVQSTASTQGRQSFTKSGNLMPMPGMYPPSGGDLPTQKF